MIKSLATVIMFVFFCCVLTQVLTGANNAPKNTVGTQSSTLDDKYYLMLRTTSSFY